MVGRRPSSAERVVRCPIWEETKRKNNKNRVNGMILLFIVNKKGFFNLGEISEVFILDELLDLKFISNLCSEIKL